MLTHLILFEWKFYQRKISFYVMLVSFFAFGILLGTLANIGFPNIKYNSPYAINFIIGLFSLACLLPIVIISSQSLFREKDSRFEQLLYTTPIKIAHYFISRFLVVVGITTLTFLLFTFGYMLGHLIVMDSSEKWGVFNSYYYLHTFLVLILPTIFLCAILISCTAWFTKNKILVYLSGLGIYVLYMVSAIFTNSPLITSGSPPSEITQQIAAKLDPFGISAFFEQTRYWTTLERNTTVLQLSGNFLLNRLFVLFLAMLLIFIAYKLFRFKIANSQSGRTGTKSPTFIKNPNYIKISTKTEGNFYFITSAFSFIKMDFISTIKSLPFIVLLAITLFILGMEMYGAIEGGVRLPQYFVTTTLMANTILATLPNLINLTLLFYGSELVWKSKSANFSSIEHSTPFSITALFISKVISLTIIIFALIAISSVLGLIFQKIYFYPIIDWTIYTSLFYFIGIPAMLCGIVILALQYLIKNKYIALSIAVLFIGLTVSPIGKVLCFSHPLLRFTNFLPDAISDISGFDYLPNAFLTQMIYSLAFTLFLSLVVVFFHSKSILTIKLKQVITLMLPTVLAIITGYYINTKSNSTSNEEVLNWQSSYEGKFKHYKNIPQPSIVSVKTLIDLFPKQNSYKVKGTYVLVNKTNTSISEILVNTNTGLKWNILSSSQLVLAKKDKEFGQNVFITKKQLLPNDSITLYYDFEYKIEPLQGHSSFNAIVANGAFMRISNYFPTIGYNTENELENEEERKQRNLSLRDKLTKVDAPLADPYNYEFIHFDALISTSANQTAISVGELVNNYTKNNRNFFHYRAKNIPFRFAVSSAKYAIQKSRYNNISIEILFEPKHYQNIIHLIKSIKNTLHYCETNFGKYPYSTFRFAEISSFTKGFAATAYPATIFINEKQFHLNLNTEGGQDIINEIVAHELSHQWWGNAQLQPDYREGSGVLTETLAQYTQLMLYKHEYGIANMLQMVNLYKELYNSGKAFSSEEPLYTSNPNNSNSIYNKGLIKMYELYLLIGEEKINLALKQLLVKHKFPLRPATIADLLKEFKMITEVTKHKKIDELFKE